MISAYTLTYVEEAAGIVRAARAAGLPVSISFTVETDGRLPSEEPLREAIERLDAETGSAALYTMINCAHPTHFSAALDEGGAWLERIGGIRANASREPRGTRRVRGARRRRPGRVRRRIRRSGAEAAEPARGRRLLRHRSAPRSQRLRALPAGLGGTSSAGSGARRYRERDDLHLRRGGLVERAAFVGLGRGAADEVLVGAGVDRVAGGLERVREVAAPGFAAARLPGVQRRSASLRRCFVQRPRRRGRRRRRPR